MKELKFRYVFKKPSGHIVLYFTDIQHLEHSDIANFLQHNFLSIERDLISRDQFIGTQDKNDREIYEGDLYYPSKYSDYPAEVYYDERSCQFRGRVKGEMQYDKTYNIAFAKYIEVIGNIHQNPELLEAKNVR